MKMMSLLYPAMEFMVKFYYFRDIIKVLPAFKRAFSYDFNDPKYMPVTRELSE
jgi:hypothetical protein